MAATPTSALGFQNFFSATLTGDLTASTTDILMDAIPNATEGFLVIEPDSTTAREVIFYNSKTALKVVCPSAADGRGQDDTTAGAHSTGATVIMAPVAGFWEAFQSGRAFTDQVINTSKLNKASEFIYDFVASGVVITGDSLGVNKNYSVSSGVVYIGGKRLTVAAVSAQTVGASKDRYIDLRDNGDGTAVFVTNEVNNNAASQALTAGDMRVGIVVAGATTIANAGSINQGEHDKVLPIASSIPYTFTDSLGNIICPRDPNRKLIGFRRKTNSQAITAEALITELNVPYIVPTLGRMLRITLYGIHTNTSSSTQTVRIRQTNIAGATLNSRNSFIASATASEESTLLAVLFAAAGSANVVASIAAASGTATWGGDGSTSYLMVEIIA